MDKAANDLTGQGLSPPTRGNLWFWSVNMPFPGSIPAHAG